MPDVSLLAAGHLGVALVLLVLRRVRRLDEAGVNDPSRRQLQAGLEELLVDRLKDLRAELMLLEQMPELQDRGLIRRAVHQVQADELPRGGVLEQEVFHAGIAQVVRNLEQVDAKHQIQRERLAAPPSGRGVMGADQILKGCPGNEFFEPLRQAFHVSLARLAAKAGFKICEGELFHGMPRLSIDR